MFLRPLVEEYADVAEVVALCDRNPRRLDVACQLVGRRFPLFTDFAAMLASVPCDGVIVTTVDGTHDEFIIGALRSGKDVITEKPMTIDAPRCRAILAAERASRGKVTVTFNYRFAPYATRVKELLQSGVIGKIHSVEFSWTLDTIHGADYYRRWHRRKEHSGGLFVHKATHHFDLLNWWLEQKPVRVMAMGRRNFYGPTRSERGERCRTCSYAERCEFHFDLGRDAGLRRLYLECEGEDGYFRDRCIFDPEIDIEDTMSALVEYSGGTQLNYSLHSFAPFEGWRAAFNGSLGRLEAGVAETYYPEEARSLAARERIRISADPLAASRGEVTPLAADEIRIYPLFGGVQVERVPRAAGGHGGGDERLREMLFGDNVPDPLGHAAGSEAGALSILIGAAANESMRTGMPVWIDDLLHDAGAEGAQTPEGGSAS